MSRKKQVYETITALYCRISLDDGGDNESMSISNQKLMLRDFAEKHGTVSYTHLGSKYEEMLCLVGGQGAGKSSFFRLLAIRDEWFSDDLKKLDDDRVFLKLQGHWIIEMSEMLATSSAKSIEEIRSFISRQKETYRTPYELSLIHIWGCD